VEFVKKQRKNPPQRPVLLRHSIFKRRIRCIAGQHASPAGVIIRSLPNTSQCSSQTGLHASRACGLSILILNTVRHVITLLHSMTLICVTCLFYVSIYKGECLFNHRQSFFLSFLLWFKLFALSAMTQEIVSCSEPNGRPRGPSGDSPLGSIAGEVGERRIYITHLVKRASPHLIDAGGGVLGEDGSICSLNAGTSSQTSQQQSVTMGNVAGRDWPCPTLLCLGRNSVNR